MSRFFNFWPIAAALAAAISLGVPRPAHAYIEIDYSINGGARMLGASDSGGSVSWTNHSVGGLFDVSFSFGTSNSPGNAQALVTQANNSVSTLYSSGSNTLSIFVSSTGFTSPMSPPFMLLGTSSSITQNSGQTNVVFTSYVDPNNNPFGMSGSSVMSTQVAYSATGQQGTGATAVSQPFTLSTSAYSLTNKGDYTMAAGTDLTVVSGNSSISAVPAPPGIVLAGVGILALGVGGMARRKGVFRPEV
jgi:hypothetical protein